MKGCAIRERLYQGIVIPFVVVRMFNGATTKTPRPPAILEPVAFATTAASQNTYKGMVSHNGYVLQFSVRSLRMVSEVAEDGCLLNTLFNWLPLCNAQSR